MGMSDPGAWSAPPLCKTQERLSSAGLIIAQTGKFMPPGGGEQGQACAEVDVACGVPRQRDGDAQFAASLIKRWQMLRVVLICYVLLFPRLKTPSQATSQSISLKMTANLTALANCFLGWLHKGSIRKRGAKRNSRTLLVVERLGISVFGKR